MTLESILFFIVLNIKIVAKFLILYSLFGMIIYSLYSICIMHLPLLHTIKNYHKILRLLFVFKYPLLKIYNISAMKSLIAKSFIPIGHLNLFWINKKEIQLDNVKYEIKGAKNGVIELNKMILKKESIEIFYNIKSKDNIKLISKKGYGKDLENKVKNRNIFCINDKEYVCEVASDKIIINCSGYYIFNNSKLELKTKVNKGEYVNINIDASNFFDFEEKYDVKDLIDISNFLCQICFLVCFLVVLLIYINININIIFSVMIVEIIILRFLSSFTRRLFDIFKAMR